MVFWIRLSCLECRAQPPEPAHGPSLHPRTSNPASRGSAPGAGRGIGQRLDADGDGKISRSEARGRLKQRFDEIDKNSDGYLDESELTTALRDLGGR